MLGCRLLSLDHLVSGLDPHFQSRKSPKVPNPPSYICRVPAVRTPALIFSCSQAQPRRHGEGSRNGARLCPRAALVW